MTTTVTEFQNVMGWAKRLAADSNRAGLEDLIKIVLRPVQADRMRVALTRPSHRAPDGLWWTRSMGGLWDGQGPDGTWLSYVCKHGRRDVQDFDTISLGRDVVLPTLWSESSIRKTLGAIGSGRPCGPFQQDGNHHVTLMLPFRIAWVDGGNHSIAQGILGGEGRLIPQEVIDVSAIVAAVRYDGECWVCPTTGARLQGPIYPEFGWAWEISHLLLNLPEMPNR
ncbi:DUF6710 family protein [Pseudomonas putida]|uniref:DUF6710 family protein n=1 Tax=Pseudomonas putida TaxID=303 RepID=UPI0037C5FC44